MREALMALMKNEIRLLPPKSKKVRPPKSKRSKSTVGQYSGLDFSKVNDVTKENIAYSEVEHEEQDEAEGEI